MANFTPRGIIKIGRVPFNNSYTDVMTFGSKQAQTDYFSSVCSKSLSQDDYTYVRANSSIRVPYNAEALYTYNYVMYQNANYGNKWFYCFIVGVNYVNANNTELVLETDVMQTWWYDWNFKECLVEREHVNNDAIGANLNPEPSIPVLQTYRSVTTLDELSSDKRWIVVQTNEEPHYSYSTKADGCSAVNGGMYQHAFSGAAYYAFDGELTEDAGSDSSIANFLRGLNEGGGADSVSNIFMVPKVCIKTINIDSDHKVTPGHSDEILFFKEFSRPTSLDNRYVPKNNKLFTFPYTFCRLSDNNGSVKDLRYEYFSSTPKVEIRMPLDPDCQCIVIPRSYSGVLNNFSESFSFPVTATCSWPFSSFENWSAQNKVANAAQVLTDVALMAIPAVAGVGAAVKTSNTLYKTFSAIGKSTRYPIMKDAAAEAISKVGGLLPAAIGAKGLTDFAGNYSREEKQPNTLRGKCTGNALYQADMQNLSIYSIVPKYESCVILDNFFEAYGYQVDKVKKPNVTGRPYWNYVKTKGAKNWGNVPADDMALINDIFDNGVTFWHTTDIGNYSLNNH